MANYNDKPDFAEVRDRLRAMRLQEDDSAYRCWNYNEKRNRRLDLTFPSNTCVDEICRVKMCEWCYQVVDSYQFSRTCVSIAFSFLDRYICTPKGKVVLNNREEYQLAAMTALYIAIKIHEHVKMDAHMLASFSQGVFTTEHVQRMEQSILSSLHWRLCKPTQFDFIQDFISLIVTEDALSTSASSSSSEIINYIASRSNYQAELAVAEISLVGCLPSEIALSAIINAISEVGIKDLTLDTRIKFLRNIKLCTDLNVNSTALSKIQSTLNLLAIGISPATVDDEEQDTMDDDVMEESQMACEKNGSYCHSPVGPVTPTEDIIFHGVRNPLAHLV